MLQFYSEFKKSSQIIYIFQIILISLLFEHLSKSTSFLGFFLKKSDKFFPAGRWRRKKKKDRNFSTKVPAECGDSRLVFHILERHECIRGWKKLKRPRKFIRVPLQGYTMLKIELENTRTIFLTRKKKKRKRTVLLCSHILHSIFILSSSSSPSVYKFIFENTRHSLPSFSSLSFYIYPFSSNYERENYSTTERGWKWEWKREKLNDADWTMISQR